MNYAVLYRFCSTSRDYVYLKYFDVTSCSFTDGGLKKLCVEGLRALRSVLLGW